MIQQSNFAYIYTQMSWDQDFIEIWSPMFIISLFIMFKIWKHPKCPPTNKKERQMWFHTISYSALKGNWIISIHVGNPFSLHPPDTGRIKENVETGLTHLPVAHDPLWLNQLSKNYLNKWINKFKNNIIEDTKKEGICILTVVIVQK